MREAENVEIKHELSVLNELRKSQRERKKVDVVAKYQHLSVLKPKKLNSYQRVCEGCLEVFTLTSSAKKSLKCKKCKSEDQTLRMTNKPKPIKARSSHQETVTIKDEPRMTDKFSHLNVLLSEKCYTINRRCSACKNTFPTTVYDKGRAIRIKFSAYTCLNCRKAEKERLRKASDRRRTYTCDRCGITKTTVKYVFRQHVESHLDLKCDACNGSLKNRRVLRIHLLNHFESHVCEICGLSTSNPSRLRRHLETHDADYATKQKTKKEKTKTNEELTCQYCPVTFYNISSLQCHVRQKHRHGESKPLLKCSKCTKSFFSKDQLREHNLEHFVESGGKLRLCDYPGCGKGFRTGKRRTIHKKCHEENTVKCELCKKTFRQKGALRKHRKGRCIVMKQATIDEEATKIAEIARAQHERLFPEITKTKAIDRIIKVFQNVEEDNSDAGESFAHLMPEFKQEIETENIKTSSDMCEIAEVVIKEEPQDDWSLVTFDAVVKQEYEFEATLEPVVVLNRLEENEILHWTRVVKKEVDESIEDDASDNWAEEIESLKNEPTKRPYNKGLPRAKKQKVFKLIHRKGLEYVCDLCGITFIKRCNLVKHLKQHKLAKKMTNHRHCIVGLCNRIFPNRQELINHKQKDHGLKYYNIPSSDDFYLCDLCNKRYATLINIKSHMLRVHTLLKCPTCNEPNFSKRQLQHHMREQHKNGAVCHICGFVCKNVANLKIHVRTHGEKTPCKVCGKFVSNMPAHLYKHQRTQNETFLPCSLCGKMYSKYRIKLHMNRVHLKVPQKNILYRCNDCSSEFTRLGDLRSHKTENHWKGKIFNCSICNRQCRTKKKLRIHMNCHRPKSLNCGSCNRIYSSRAALRKHLKLHHPHLIKIEDGKIILNLPEIEK